VSVPENARLSIELRGFSKAFGDYVGKALN